NEVLEEGGAGELDAAAADVEAAPGGAAAAATAARVAAIVEGKEPGAARAAGAALDAIVPEIAGIYLDVAALNEQPTTQPGATGAAVAQSATAARAAVAAHGLILEQEATVHDQVGATAAREVHGTTHAVLSRVARGAIAAQGLVVQELHGVQFHGPGHVVD